MQSLDFSPFYRSTVGFDRLFSLLDNSVSQDTVGYPPYNIERTGDDAYRITMAVAGFAADEISIEAKENTLSVRGAKTTEAEDKQRQFLHRGIAERTFERRFQLADYVEVKGAELENGLLHLDLVRELPESKRPRQIAISAKAGKAKGKTIEDKTAH